MPQPDAGAIARALSDLYRHTVPAAAVAPLGAATVADQAPDATLKFTAPLSDGGDGVLLASSAGNPGLVARAVANIDAARARVSARTAAPILPPAATGEVDGYSFAVWPRHVPFETPSRLRRNWRRVRYGPAILAWSVSFARETAGPADTGEVRRDLSALAGHERLPEKMHQTVETALSRLDRGVWQPVTCLQHGDFWAGNILLPRAGPSPDFHVIDWAGMLRRGYPFFDLARMLVSLNVGPRSRRAHVARLGAALDIAAEDVLAHLLAALGAVARDLEHFPPDRFRAMAVASFDAVKAQ